MIDHPDSPPSDQPWIPLTVGQRRAAPAPPPRAAARAAGPGDQGYIASTWLQQMADADRDYSRGGARGGHLGRHIDMTLDRPDTRAIVVHPTEDASRILAFLVYAHVPGVPVIHACYTRSHWNGEKVRERGYAKALLAKIGVRPDVACVYTCHLPMERLLLKRYKLATYLPLFQFLGLKHKEPPPEDRWKDRR